MWHLLPVTVAQRAKTGKCPPGTNMRLNRKCKDSESQVVLPSRVAPPPPCQYTNKCHRKSMGTQLGSTQLISGTRETLRMLREEVAQWAGATPQA